MKQQLRLSAEQNSLLRCVKAGYKIPVKAKKSLIERHLMTNDNHITQRGKEALNTFDGYLRRNMKAVKYLSDVVQIYNFIIIALAFIEMIIGKIKGLSSIISIILIVIIVVMAISEPIISHFINKHYHLK